MLKSIRRRRIPFAFLALLAILWPLKTANAAPANIARVVRCAFEARARGLFERGDGAQLALYYDQAYSHGEDVVGKRLVDYERDKIAEFHGWLDKRNINVIAHRVDLHFKDLTVHGEIAHVKVTENIGFHWVYADKPDRSNASGLGTDHEVDLVLKRGQWLIRRDDYVDPFRQWLKADHRTRRR